MTPYDNHRRAECETGDRMDNVHTHTHLDSPGMEKGRLWLTRRFAVCPQSAGGQRGQRRRRQHQHLQKVPLSLGSNVRKLPLRRSNVRTCFARRPPASIESAQMRAHVGPNWPKFCTLRQILRNFGRVRRPASETLLRNMFQGELFEKQLDACSEHLSRDKGGNEYCWAVGQYVAQVGQ